MALAGATSSHGGKRKGAGRPRWLSEDVRHQIGGACEKRAWARAAAEAYLKDPLDPNRV
jgi:hypothetical protein